MSDLSQSANMGFPRNGDAAREETATLISSDKVEGTSVFDGAGSKLGSIHSLMIEKRGGRVSYAVLSFGGLLGLGQSYFPIPWSQLSYRNDLDGYTTTVTQAQLTDAPKYDTAEPSSWADGGWRSAVDTHYRAPGA